MQPLRLARLCAFSRQRYTFVTVKPGNNRLIGWPHSEGENVVSNHTPPETIPEKRRGGDRESMALAVVMAWYPGMLGGRALARLLSGELNFSGRIPFAWPSSKNKLQPFDAYAERVEYSYYHGYTWFDHSQQRPAYPMGFGLNYGMPVSYENLRAFQLENELRVQVMVENPGSRARREVVQCYVGAPTQLAVRHRKNLKALDVIELAGGEQRAIELAIPLPRLRRYCAENQLWLFDVGEYRLWIGPSRGVYSVAKQC